MERWRKWWEVSAGSFSEAWGGSPQAGNPISPQGPDARQPKRNRLERLRTQVTGRSQIPHTASQRPNPAPAAARTDQKEHVQPGAKCLWGPGDVTANGALSNCHHLSINHTFKLIQEAACRCLCSFPGQLHTLGEEAPGGTARSGVCAHLSQDEGEEGGSGGTAAP